MTNYSDLNGFAEISTMFTIQRCLVLPAAIVAMIAMSSVAAAQCDTNNQTTTTAGFGYPSGNAGCQPCGGRGLRGGGAVGGLFHNIRDGIDRYKADAALVQARGSAWPKPFNCWDREAFYSIFNQQYAHGLQTAHLLTSDCFNTETDELNRAGESRVAWIMQKAAAADKQIFVYEDVTGPALERRLANIRDFTDRYYAHLGDVRIATSQIQPNMIPAAYQEQNLRQYFEGQPVPIIPVQVGSTIDSSVGN